MGDPAKKLYSDAMKLPVRERRALAQRVLASVHDLPTRVQVVEPEPLPEPERRAEPKEILALAAAVYEGLSENEIREIEAVALDRRNFSVRPA
jgi:hypothetical protein